MSASITGHACSLGLMPFNPRVATTLGLLDLILQLRVLPTITVEVDHIKTK